jgi:hypothetical protein
MQTRKSKFHKYLEMAVNISLVVVCLSLVGVVAKKYFISSAIKSVKVGDKISFPDLSWTKGQKGKFSKKLV